MDAGNADGGPEDAGVSDAGDLDAGPPVSCTDDSVCATGQYCDFTLALCGDGVTQIVAAGLCLPDCGQNCGACNTDADCSADQICDTGQCSGLICPAIVLNCGACVFAAAPHNCKTCICAVCP